MAATPRVGSGADNLQGLDFFLVFISKEPIASFFSVQGPLCKNKVGENLCPAYFTKQHLC
jgi:hypothetical protein